MTIKNKEKLFTMYLDRNGFFLKEKCDSRILIQF